MSDLPVVTCRLAGLGDVDAIARIHVAAFESHYRGVLADELLDARDLEVRRRMWTQLLQPPASVDPLVTVAERDGEIVGFASSEPTWYEDQDPARVINFNRLYLRPGLEGGGARGVGQALYDDQERRWREHGFPEVTGQIGVENERSMRFFTRMGWSPDGYERRAPDGSLELRVGKRLSEQPAVDVDRGPRHEPHVV